MAEFDELVRELKEEFLKIAKNLDDAHAKATAAKVVGGFAAAAGLAASPFTGGLSLAFLAGLTGGGVIAGGFIFEYIITKDKLELVEVKWTIFKVDYCRRLHFSAGILRKGATDPKKRLDHLIAVIESTKPLLNAILLGIAVRGIIEASVTYGGKKYTAGEIVRKIAYEFDKIPPPDAEITEEDIIREVFDSGAVDRQEFRHEQRRRQEELEKLRREDERRRQEEEEERRWQEELRRKKEIEDRRKQEELRRQKELETTTTRIIEEEYKDEAKYERARPLFHTVIKQRSGSQITPSLAGVAPGSIQNQLQGSSSKIQGALEHFASSMRRKEPDLSEQTPTFVWMSEALPLYLNLPVDKSPPLCAYYQILFIGEKIPAFVLTLYDLSNVPDPAQQGDSREEVDAFTVHVARLLTSSLLNFCACDFVMLPCLLDCQGGNLNKAALKLEVEKEMEFAAKYHSREQKLIASTVWELHEAVTAAASVTRVPYLLRGIDRDQMMLLDTDWRQLLFHIIDLLVDRTRHRDETYDTTEKEFELKVAVIEAAKRLSLSKEVAVITRCEDINQCVRCLRQRHSEYHEPEPKLSAVVSESTKCVIFIDYEDKETEGQYFSVPSTVDKILSVKRSK